MDKKIHIYYDGVCNLCSGLMDKIKGSSRADDFTPIPVSKDTLPATMSLEEAIHAVQVVDVDGTVYSGVDAVLKVLEQYPHLRALAQMGRLPGIHALGVGVYRIVAETRYWIFGRKHV